MENKSILFLRFSVITVSESVSSDVMSTSRSTVNGDFVLLLQVNTGKIEVLSEIYIYVNFIHENFFHQSMISTVEA